jgi:hypothetical protein
MVMLFPSEYEDCQDRDCGFCFHMWNPDDLKPDPPVPAWKRWVDTCTHEFPHIVGRQLTCDARSVTICSRCGQEVQ